MKTKIKVKLKKLRIKLFHKQNKPITMSHGKEEENQPNSLKPN